MFDMQAKKLSHQISIQSRLLLIVIVMFWLQSCTVDKRGAGTPDRVVEQYLLALETKNEKLMLELVPENSNFARAVKTKIDKIGGQKIQARQITYVKPKPVLWEAKINGVTVDTNGIERKFDDSIVLEYQSKGELKLYAGRWYLIPQNR
jgi:hypothetical protein